MPVRIIKDKDLITTVSIVLDCSGSMETIRDSVIDSFNEYMTSLKRSGGNYVVSLLPFSQDVHKPVYDMEPISEVKNLARHSYIPEGSTALYDAIGTAMNRLIAYKEGKEMNVTSLFVIITDGQENSSHEWTKEQIKTRITEMEAKYNCKFIYLAANQDAWEVGRGMGIDMGNAAVFQATASGTRSAMTFASSATMSFHSASMDIGDWKATDEKTVLK